MGTNYYMMTKNKEIVERYFPGEYELVDTPDFGYEVHIGKRSWGWKPLFEEHSNAYSSVEGLKEFLKVHSDNFCIYNEYNDVLTAEQLDKELFQWGENQEVKYWKYISDGVENKFFSEKTHLISSTLNDYDIKTPFDHIEYFNLACRWEEWCRHRENPYLKDKAGYNFMKGRFS